MTDARADPITIETVLAIDELESGRVLARTVADLRLGAFGDEQEALLEHTLYLGEHLRRLGAIVQARFSLPQIELDQVIVEMEPPLSISRDRRKPLRVAMPCAVLPDGKARWAVVLPLGLTVYVAANESLEEVVATEAARHVGVWAPGPWDLLGLLPSRETRLVRLPIAIPRGALLRASDLRKRIDEAQKRKHARSVLESVGRLVRPEDLPRTDPVGLEEPLGTLTALLGSKERRSILIVGEERVGKSELVHAWRRANPDGPPLYATSGAQLIAGMSALGQWQERVGRVMEAAETLDAIVYFDDLRDLFGDHSGGHVDLPAAIKPWLDEERVRVIGELTPEAADLFATRQAGLTAHLLPVRVMPQDARAASQALSHLREHAARHEPDRPQLDAEGARAIVELADRYLPYRPFPGKAVRLYHELRSSSERAHRGKSEALSAADVYQLFSVQTGIPIFLLRDDREWRAERGRELLRRRLVGQREAVAHVIDTLCVIKAGLAPRDKPLASFLFCGPTGVGKTELARALAELLFGHADRLVRFDMSELADPMAAERLIRGTESDEGELTAKVRQQPFCVVLLDEIEKAHPAVFDLLLQVLGEGRLTDARGRTAHFHNAIVVMTSNLGTQHRSQRIGIAPAQNDERARVLAAVHASFRPELVNRIDRIVLFHPLEQTEIREVAQHLVRAIARRRGLVEQSLALEVTEAALDRLSEHGFAPAYGARALRRHLEDELAAPLARLLSRLGRRARGARAICRALDEPAASGHRLASATRGEIAIEVVQGGEGLSHKDTSELARISALRRWAHQKLELPTVEEVRERVAYLTAELAYGRRDRQSPGPGDLQTELSRSSAALRRFEDARTQLDEIEELALAAYLSGESSSVLGDEARAADLAVRAGLLSVLLAPVPRPRISIAIQEHDRHRPLDRWLGGMLEVAKTREWRIHGHVYEHQGYGEALDAEKLAKLLREPRDALALILRVQGPDAGTLLALEGGVHRYVEPSEGVEQTTFIVRPLAQRVDLTEAEMQKPVAAPVALGPIGIPELRLLPAVREVYADRVAIGARAAEVQVERDRYWHEHDVIALEHLLLLEPVPELRALLFIGPLDAPPA